METTKAKPNDIRRYAQAVKHLLEDVNPLGQSRILKYMSEKLGVGSEEYDIEKLIKITVSRTEDVDSGWDYHPLLREVIVAVQDNKISTLELDNCRPQSPIQVNKKPEAAAVTTTTTERSTTPAQGKSKRQTMKDMWETMQESMSQDEEEIENISNRIFTERFKPSLVDAFDNGCFPEERIQELIDSTPPKTDDDQIRVMIDESFRSGVGKVVAGDVKSGDKVLLPPRQSVCPYFVQTSMSDDIEYHFNSGQHIYVDGPSGAGKTYPIEQVLRKLGKRYVKVNFADGIRLSDLTTKQEIVVQDGKTQTKYIDGILPFCMRHGLALIGDEVDQLQPETTSIFNPTTDKFPGELLLPGSGERVVAAPGFWVAFTGNCLTDETGLYSGYKSSNALTNRCAALKASYLDSQQEIQILEKDGLDTTEARMIVNVMNVLRDKYLKGGSVSQAPSTRQAVRISRYIQGKNVYGKVDPNLPPMGRSKAWHFTYFNFLPKSEYTEAITACNSVDNSISNQ